MTLLSRKADYALLILSYLHRQNEGASAREVADHFGLSRSFAANILKELCQKGFVTSHRGVNGGYLLQRPADEVTLGELLASIEDGFHLAACNDLTHDDACSFSNICPMKTPMAEVHRRIVEVLGRVTLAELFPATGTPHTGLTLPLLPPVAAVMEIESR